MNTNSEIFFTPDQAASFFGVTTGTLAVWRCTGRYPLPFVKVGRSIRYRKSDCINFAESRTLTQTQ